MAVSGIAEPEQLAVLTAVLEEICAGAGIEPDSPEREDAALLLIRLYWDGHRTAGSLISAFVTQVDQEAKLYG
jgi:hypothetical protein